MIDTYDIQQAVEDGATVPIYYESRIAKLGLNASALPKLDTDFDEITEGDDRLGVLLMGHPYKSWWTGSLLSIEESRRLIPGQSATTVQVGSAVYAAVVWAMDNPDRGYMVPDDMPWREVLEIAEPYWNVTSVQSDWTPISDRNDLFKGWNGREYDESDPWQFKNFLV